MCVNQIDQIVPDEQAEGDGGKEKKLPEIPIRRNPRERGNRLNPSLTG